jgi:hypothetical protein
VYQNFGQALAPLAGMLGSLENLGPGGQKALQGLSDMKPTLIAAYGEPDRIEVAASGTALGLSLNQFLHGNLLGIAGHALPFANPGTLGRQPAYR